MGITMIIFFRLVGSHAFSAYNKEKIFQDIGL